MTNPLAGVSIILPCFYTTRRLWTCSRLAGCGSTVMWEVGLQSNPTLVVIKISIRRIKSPPAHTRDERRLEHERQRTTEPEWLIGISTADRCLVCLGVWSMWCHAAVQASTSGEKTISLGLHIQDQLIALCIILEHNITAGWESNIDPDACYLVYPINQAHELTHAVAMVVWRTERIFSNQPPWWEYYKVK